MFVLDLTHSIVAGAGDQAEGGCLHFPASSHLLFVPAVRSFHGTDLLSQLCIFMGFNGVRNDILARISRWLLVCRNGSLFLLPSTICVLALGLLRLPVPVGPVLCDWKDQLSFFTAHTLCVSSCLVLVTQCCSSCGWRHLHFFVDKHSVLPLLGCSALGRQIHSIPRVLNAPQWNRKPFTCFCVLCSIRLFQFLDKTKLLYSFPQMLIQLMFCDSKLLHVQSYFSMLWMACWHYRLLHWCFESMLICKYLEGI